mmetsp:Transcript_9897/g.18607  ORF Transcript_9897/g.18607 Transcript_9897/m.18607 type:complete len:508 (+) Transcript_9897:166-1689(+)
MTLSVRLQEEVQPAVEEGNSSLKHLRTNLHKFASAGDVEAIKALIEANEGIDINISGKGKNTALHSALSHNQQGLVIDYLISKGANVNAFNTKGYNLLILAVIYCQPGTHALEKLIRNGADWRTKFRRGKFSGLNLIDVASQFKNMEALQLLQRLEDDITDDDDVKQNKLKHDALLTRHMETNHKKCPICDCTVKFPTKMSFLLHDQAEAEKKLGGDNLLTKSDNNEPRRNVCNQETKEIYTCRKYLDEFLEFSHGKVYKELCRIEYHGIGNKSKLRKEISESFSILHAIQYCILELRAPSKSMILPTCNAPPSTILKLENVFLIDLCSGKSLTTVLCGALFLPMQQGNTIKNEFLAVDRLPLHLVPHFMTCKNTRYLSRDIMSKDFFNEINDEIKRQTLEGRTTVLVGMHLCGILSERAISLFLNIPSIKALVLSPCCLPKLRKAVSGFDEFEKNQQDTLYVSWCKYLKNKIEVGSLDSKDTINVRWYFDHHVHSIKNAIITATRQ